jgi:serine/threonine-protein kinase
MKCSKCQSDNPDTQQYCGECGTHLIPSKEIPVTETLETPKEELTTGTTFGERYQIIEELGKGGMGKVYRVLDKELKEEVALKLIKPEIASDKKTLERFSNELKLARKISHKNVGRMYELMEEKGTRYITMEYVPGEDLKRLIRKVGQFSAGKTVSIAKQVCEGLAEAHRLGVVHRDLKPQNVMVDEEGNARIMDFGIARSVKGKGITGAGVMVGTPEYMSPEQAEVKEVDQRSDIYSLGVILYEMVTGTVPFEGETPLSIAMKHKSEIPKDPRELNTQMPEDLSRVILRCMEKDKGKRYKNAEELLSELSKIEEAKRETIKTPEWKNSIAVLPFKNMSADPEQEYFCEGLAEELINAFTQIQDLRVVARTSAFYFKGKDVDIQEIGKKLNVEKVLEGSVRKAGNRLRIMAQLINVKDGYHLWSERFDRRMDNIFAIQDEITLAIVDKLKVRLLGQEKEKLVKRRTEDHEAYHLYLKGRYYLNKRTEADLIKSLEYFEQAIIKDPKFAVAYAGLADAYVALGWHNYRPGEFAYTKAKKEALKAIEIDNSVGEAHASIALIKQLYEWDWPGAEREYKQALMLSPSYAEARHQYSHLMALLGRFDEAIAEMKQALEIEPLSVVMNSCVGQQYYFARKFDEAIQQHRKAIEMDPNHYLPHFHIGYDYHQKRMFKEAISEFQTGIDLSGDIARAKGALGQTYAQWNKKDMARRLIDQLEKGWESRYVATYIAQIFVGLGQKDEAFEWLDKAYEARDPYLIYLEDPMWDDPRFTALLKKMNLE